MARTHASVNRMMGLSELDPFPLRLRHTVDIAVNSSDTTLERTSRSVAVADLMAAPAGVDHAIATDESLSTRYQPSAVSQGHAGRAVQPSVGNGVALSSIAQLTQGANHRVPDAVTVDPKRIWYLPFKGCFDFVMALGLLVLALPFIAFGAIAIKLSSKGPAFYTQVRVGRRGRLFTLVKIRTMVQDAEAGTGPVWSSGTGTDSRITPLGKILRDSHIDELPQLFNVLAGDMSLVGPRPERPEFVAQLERKIPHYRQRLNLRPGITGLAQVLLPPDSGVESVAQKTIHDIYYVRNCSFWMDVKLIAATGWKVVKQLTHHILRVFGLPDHQKITHGYSLAVTPHPTLDSERK